MGQASGGSVLTGFGRLPAHKHALRPRTEEKRGPTHGLGTKAQATPAQHTHNPALLPRTRRTFRAGKGEGRWRTQHARNPATLPLANLQPHHVHRRLSYGPMVASPPRNCHSTSRVHQTRCPALWVLGAPEAHLRARTL